MSAVRRGRRGDHGGTAARACPKAPSRRALWPRRVSARCVSPRPALATEEFCLRVKTAKWPSPIRPKRPPEVLFGGRQGDGAWSSFDCPIATRCFKSSEPTRARDSQWRSYLPCPLPGRTRRLYQIPLATHRRTNPPPAKTKTDSQQSSELASAVQLLTIVGAVRFVNVHCVVSEARQRNASEEDCHYRHVHCEAARIGGRDQVLMM